MRGQDFGRRSLPASSKARGQATLQTKPRKPSSCGGTREGSGHGRAGASDNVPLCAGRNYEGDRSQPTLDVIRKLSLALDVTADELVFDSEERMPMVTDKELIRQWEQVEELPEEDRQALKVLVEGLLMRRQISRLQPTP